MQLLIKNNFKEGFIKVLCIKASMNLVNQMN